jgi:predicted HicB family RNase H-like nuclease
MTDETTPPETAQITSDSAEAPPQPKESRLGKLIAGVSSASKFAWHTCLGSAVVLEEKVVNLSYKMAEKGSEFEKQTKGKLDSRKTRLSSASAGFKAKAQEKIVDVEQVIDKGVNRSLHMIGVPSRKDMNQLTNLMQDMADSISDLASQIEAQKGAGARSKKTTKSASQSSVA